MNQRGFVIYALLGALALAGAAGAWAWVQGKRLEAAKASLEACQSRYAEALEAIRRQNEAVEAFKKSSQEAQDRATAALAAARQAQAGSLKERERLKALLGQKPPAGPCPAGSAVSEIRQGLTR